MAMHVNVLAYTVSRTKKWLDRPRLRDRSRLLAAALVVLSGIAWAIGIVYETHRDPTRPIADLPTVEVDRADVAWVLTENGSVESSDDAVIRCRVESFLGLPITATTGNFVPPPAGTRSPRASIGGGMASSTSRGGSSRSAAGPTTRLGAERDPSQGAGGSGAARSAAGGPTAAVAAANAARAAGASPTRQRPVIRSFEHVVEPHTPLRSTLPDSGAILTAAPKPPTIISIVPEGTRVSAGDVVCELDSSVFRDALPVQQIRCVQAKAWLDQARYIVDANEIALREYQHGILPQDFEQVRDYITICELEAKQVRTNLAWSRAAAAKGYRTLPQVEADAAAVDEAELALREARGMLVQLQEHTGKRIIKAHQAKIAAIRADLLSLESVSQLEGRRLKRIQTMITNCTMRAPRDGTVVYANRVSAWGSVELQIREGLPVYASQPIFRLLDPRRMRVRARINETQVARVKAGQPVSIHLEAFPRRRMRGRVAEITPIAALAHGPFSDVHSYYATVRIDSGGFDELRAGLSAELKIEVETHRQVTRVPLESVRRLGDQTFVALATPSGDDVDWRWKPIELGVSDSAFTEVVSGLEPGDRVIAKSDALPPPEPVAATTEPDQAVAMDD
jgi:HlyD family secretion protein